MAIIGPRPGGMWIKILNEIAQNKKCTVILINSRIPADKTLVSTDKSYKLVGISQKETLFKKKHATWLEEVTEYNYSKWLTQI